MQCHSTFTFISLLSSPSELLSILQNPLHRDSSTQSLNHCSITTLVYCSTNHYVLHISLLPSIVYKFLGLPLCIPQHPVKCLPHECLCTHWKFHMNFSNISQNSLASFQARKMQVWIWLYLSLKFRFHVWNRILISR